MAKYGLQPNGTVILDDGTVWNPNDPLPASAVSAFNSTPMGSPLNGLGTMAPTAIAPPPDPAMPDPSAANPPMPTSAGPIVPSSTGSAMFGGGFGGSLSPIQAQQAPAPSIMSGMDSSAGLPGVAPDFGSAPSFGTAPPPVRNGPPTFSIPGSPQQLAEMPGGTNGMDPTAAAAAGVTGPPGMFGSRPKPKFLAPGGTGRQIAGIVGNAMLAVGNPQLAGVMLQNQQKDRDTQMQAAAELAKYRMGLSAPKVEKVGNDLMVYRADGQGGVQTLYHGQSEPEAYAASLGYQAGTPEYKTAMQDYALKDAGPTSLGARQANWNADNARADAALAETRRQHDVEAAQNNQRIGLDGQRVALDGQRVALDGQRVGFERNTATAVTPTKVIGPIIAKVAAGQKLSPAEQNAFNMYKTISPMDQMVNQALAAAGAGAGGGVGAAGGMPSLPSMPAVPMAPPAAALIPRPASRYRVGQMATGPKGQKLRYSGTGWVQVNG